jgi:hypothetical protein
MADAVATDKPFLFQPNAVVKWRSEPSKGGTPRRYNGENPQPGAQIYYALPKKAEKLTLKVVDHEGKTLRELSSNAAAGIHRVNWNLARTTAQRPNGGRGPGGGPGGAGGAGQRAGGGGGAAGGGAVGPEGFQRGGGRGGFGFFGQTVNPGMYRVVLTVDGVELSQSFRVEADPALVNSVIAEPDGDDDAVIDRSK